MSLLNDALRKVERRQSSHRYPEAPSVPPGSGFPGGQRRRFLLLVLVLLLATVVVTYLLISRLQAPGAVPAEPSPSVAPVAAGPVERTESGMAPAPEPVEEESPAEPEKIADPVPQLPEQPMMAEAPAEPQVQTREPVSPPDDRTAGQSDAPPANLEPINTGNMTIGEEADTTAPSVKQKRQTPEAIDRALARDISRLVDQGEWSDARQRLRQLLATQPARSSLHVWSRALLVNGRHQEVLDWLTEERVETSPGLRLLRARALLAEGDVDLAVAGLERSVPGVQGHADYRVTLATLLYQQGRFADAAGHWAELIAWDDSQGNWWAGLAMALEARGESVAAIRAYEQASKLPGLKPTLADFVRQRLQSLRAG